MATPKTWTANDVEMGTIKLTLVGTTLSAIQGYSFIDSAGDVVEQLPKRTVTANVEFSSLSAEIQQALIAINSFMYAQALVKEGME